MKKSLILSLLVASAAAHATLVHHVTDQYTDRVPPPRPEYNYTPEVSPTSAFGIEIGGNYTCMTDGPGKDLDINTYGFDITGICNLSSNWSVSLRFSWGMGSKDIYDDYEDIDIDITNWSITPGIRYTTELSDTISWYAGANVGVGRTSIDCKAVDTFTSESIKAEVLDDISESDTGVTYTIETGLLFNCSESLYLYGSVQFWGTTAKPLETDAQQGVNFRVGMGYSF